MLPYFIGAVLIFGAANLAQIVYKWHQMSNKVKRKLNENIFKIIITVFNNFNYISVFSQIFAAYEPDTFKTKIATDVQEQQILKMWAVKW
jgi:hypothetical protein